MLKKKTNFSWNLHPLQAECAKSVFQIQPPMFGVTFSKNLLISQARVNMTETEHDATFEIF